jgi:hypothetical protein
MQAFPKDSANNALGGSGPLNKNIDLDQFHGRGIEGFTDYAASGNNNMPRRDRNGNLWNPKGALEPVHGEESVGLGTSTFLEGTPASRTDLERRDSEQDVMPLGGPAGLQRKKSLAQRIRGISQPRRDMGYNGPISAGGRVMSPEQRGPVDGAMLEGGSTSAGGRSKMNESNPFFDDYDDAYDRKGANIKATATSPDTENFSRARATSSPYRGNGLERRVTNEDGEKQGGGLINRMKSLKGGRRARPERRDV